MFDIRHANSEECGVQTVRRSDEEYRNRGGRRPHNADSGLFTKPPQIFRISRQVFTPPKAKF